MLTVKKDRESIYDITRIMKVEGVTVEIAKISEPEILYSISLEHHNLNSIKSTLNYLNISIDSHSEMKPLSYLEVIKYWFDGRNCFRDIKHDSKECKIPCQAKPGQVIYLFTFLIPAKHTFFVQCA
jgi:hypothetical protein